MRLKKLVKSIIIFVCLLCLVALLQTSAAIYFSQSKTNLVPSDLVVVFPGDSQRIEAGIQIVKDGFASHFMVISTTDADLRKLLIKNGIPETVRALPGGKSRSTFEDVYQTVRTIRENHLRSVILVTSSYHLPRALFLLHAYAKLSVLDIHIQDVSVQGERKITTELQLYSNEVIKFWGSIAEMAGCYFTGQPVLDAVNLRKIQKVLKKNILW